MAAPGTPILDAFGRTESPLSNGGNWTVWRGEAAPTTGATNGTLLQLAEAATVRGAIWHTEFVGWRVQAYCEIVKIGSASGWLEIWVGAKTTPETQGYSIEYVPGAAEPYRILRKHTEVAKFAGVGALEAKDQLWIDVSENEAGTKTTIRLYRKKGAEAWVEVGKFIDNTPVSIAGKVGFAARCNGGEWQLDNFGGGEIGEVSKPADKEDTKGAASSITIKGKNINGLTAKNLPAGISTFKKISEEEWIIEGTPTTAEETTVTLEPTGEGQTGEVEKVKFKWKINAGGESAPTITKPAEQTWTVGSAVSLEVHGERLWNLTSSNLPAGLSISAISESLWMIEGTPTTAKALTSIELKAENKAKATATVNFNATVNVEKPNPQGESLPATIVNQVMTPYFVSNLGGAVEAGGWSISSGAPAGVTINSSTGEIHGTPTATGKFSMIVKAKNVSGTGSAVVELEVVANLVTRISAVREPPPTRTVTTIKRPDGSTNRWAPDEPEPQDTPSSESWSTIMPGGFERYSATLERNPAREYPDMELLSEITVEGIGGSVAWQGRMEKVPQTGGFQSQENPEAVGYQAHLEDDQSAREIYVDQDKSRWGPMPPARRIEVLAVEDVEDASMGAGEDGTGSNLITTITGPWARQRLSAAWYDAKGIPIGRVWAVTKQGATVGPSASWNYFVILTEDQTETKNDLTSGNTEGKPAGTITQVAREASNSLKKWAIVQTLFSVANGVSESYPWFWSALAVYGRHGLTRYGTDGNEEGKGLLASDIVMHALTRWAPKLRAVIVPSEFPIPQLAFPEPTTVAEMLKQATRFELTDWAVWDGQYGPTFYMNPRGERRREWRARVGPAQLQRTGQQGSKLWNGVVVAYQDVSGQARNVGPPESSAEQTSSALRNGDPELAANQLGINKYAVIKMGTTTLQGAEQIGRRFLAETALLDNSGQATLLGTVEDTNGMLWPAWEVRAGDTISFVDASDPSPRRVVHTQYTTQDRINTIQLDQPPEGLQAVLERLSVVLVPYGMS